MARVLRLWLGALLLSATLGYAARAQTPVPVAPLTAEQYAAAGDEYARAGQYDKAVDAYRQALKLNPNLAGAYQALGAVYGRMGRPTDALEPMRAAVRLEPNNALAHFNLGITYANLRRADDALSEFYEAKRLSPNNSSIYNEIGNLLVHQFGRFEEALAVYVEARRLNPGQPVIHHNIGLTLMRLGRFADAVPPLQEALRLDPAYRSARFFLSDAYSKLRRYDESVESWTKFLELVPNDDDALTNRAWNYMYAGGHGREAAADARQFLSLYGWRANAAPYLAIIAHFGYREAKLDDEARAIINEAAKRAATRGWPAAVIEYLNGGHTGDELLRLAADNDQKTEAHAYLGLDLRLKGLDDEARAHFEWVKEYGNKRFYEYPLALQELKRMGR